MEKQIEFQNFTNDESSKQNDDIQDTKEIDQLQQDYSFENEEQNYQNVQIIQSHGIKKFYQQCSLMIYKNFLVQFKNKCSLFSLYFSPVLMFFLLMLWQYITDQVISFEIVHQPIKEFYQLPKCISGDQDNPDDCKTVQYAVIGNKEVWIDYVMQYVSHSNNLQFGKDISEIHLDNPQDIMEYFSYNQNKTQIAVIFCTSDWQISEQIDVHLPCQFEKQQEDKLIFYSMAYNFTLNYQSVLTRKIGDQFEKDPLLFRLKNSVDGGIASFFQQYTVEESNLATGHNNLGYNYDPLHQLHLPEDDIIEAYEQSFPYVTNRLQKGVDVMSSMGAFHLIMPSIIHFILVINALMQEKEKKLRQGLSVMGLSHAAYWVSWNITEVIQSAITSSILVFFGKILGYQLFINTPFIISFLLYFTFEMSMLQIANFISTIAGSTKSGQTIGYSFILVAVLMQILLTSPMLMKFLFKLDQDGNPELPQVLVQNIFSTYPAFHFSKIYHTMVLFSSRHLSLEDTKWEDGDVLTYDKLFERKREKFFLKTFYELPSIWDSYLYLLFTLLIFIVITWYCDHVFPNNRGKPESSLFFLNKNYWSCLRYLTKKQIKQKNHLNQANNPYLQYQDEDKLKNRNTIQEEKERVLYNIDNNIEAGGIRIENLGKCYRKYPFGIKSKQDFQALKSVYLEVGSNELLSILGHNGAGKSTMINVLTGILEPTSGTAYINNYNINEELEDARYHMGVCPQFDILWGELTAYQHLKLFCMLKGINRNQIEDEINRRLSQVELTHVKHAMIKTFSGGMKRRVSLAISALGNPKVIFMDEPTTGMDPKTRRKVWQLIKELKTDRAIILTTHAMEEAEALSDRIAIISQGSLQCIGRSLFLKNNFGDGYRLTIVCKTEHVQQVEKNIKNFMPNGQIVDQSGGSFIITFNQQYMDELNNFLEIIENKQSLNNQEANSFKAQVLDWGISHTTLEEVFMKITNNQS